MGAGKMAGTPFPRTFPLFFDDAASAFASGSIVSSFRFAQLHICSWRGSGPESYQAVIDALLVSPPHDSAQNSK